MKAVIQAGGKGTRLEPYTLVLPKPMMPVGNQPVIEILLRWLRRNGITETCITTGHLAHLIESFCGEGPRYDMNISYCREPEPLGTIGALRLLQEQLTETFLMINGDLITDLSLQALISSHKSSNCPLTIATTQAKTAIDFGVLETVDNRVTTFTEKPTYEFEVSMGVYIMQPELIDLIPKNVPFGFDNLMRDLLDKGMHINTYKHQGEWLDIGRIEDFTKAQSSQWTNVLEADMQGL